MSVGDLRTFGLMRTWAVTALASACIWGGTELRAAGLPSCAGDCNGDGTVEISELVGCVNTALGSAPTMGCAACDPDADGTVAINELIASVTNAVAGCPPAATPSPTASPPAGPATATGTPTPSATRTASTQTAGGCPAGTHKACHGGSGRGGGYKSICSCVINPPPVCVTAWGTRIPAGTTITLYDTNVVYAPDTCTAHALSVSCDSTGVLHPPDATGYPVCNVVSDTPAD
jgi:hypothetical protein